MRNTVQPYVHGRCLVRSHAETPCRLTASLSSVATSFSLYIVLGSLMLWRSHQGCSSTTCSSPSATQSNFHRSQIPAGRGLYLTNTTRADLVEYIRSCTGSHNGCTGWEATRRYARHVLGGVMMPHKLHLVVGFARWITSVHCGREGSVRPRASVVLQAIARPT